MDLSPYLDAARRASEANMPLACSVVRITMVSDGAGGFYEDEVVVATTKARLRDMTGSERVIASQITATVTGAVSVPLGVGVRDGDKLDIAGVRYHVPLVIPQTDKLSVHQDVLVTR